MGLLACALAALAYQGALDNPFVFDDRDTVLLNASLITPWDWRAALFHNPARPAVNLSYALDRALWGFTSFGYHVTNVVLHITAVGLFYGWCTRALSDAGVRQGSDRGQTRVRQGSDRGQTGVRQGSDEGQTRVRRRSDPSPTPEWGAFFAAAVFALHPVMSSAVGYVSGRSELLAAIGTLASLTYARRAIVASNRTSGILAIVFGALAAASSSSAAALPLLALAYDAWVLRDPGWRVRAARIYGPATLAVVIAAGWFLTARPVPITTDVGTVPRLLTDAIVLWRYAALLVLPRGQALVHDVNWITAPWQPAGLAALAFLAACAALAVTGRRSRPLLAFGAIWFLAVLTPTTSLIPVRDAMAEHRLYLACCGLLLAAASLLARPLATRGAWRVLLAAILLVLALATRHRNQIWSDPMRLWQQAVDRSPNAWQAHWGYAELLREVAQCDRAALEYRAVLRLRPDHQGALAGLQGCR